MFIPHEGPGTWQSFLKRKDNVGLTIMEARQKYLKEQLLFESYINTLNTVSTVSTAAAGAAGGPAPSTGGGGGGGDYDIEFKINTAYNITTGYYDVPNPTTRLNINFSANESKLYNTGDGLAFGNQANTWKGDVTVDWGDGTVETKTAYDIGGTNISADQSNWYGKIGLIQHNYATDGEYTVKIKGPGAYYIKWLFIPVVDFIKYDPALIQDWRMLFSYIPLAAQNNFEGDISNWVIPNNTSLAHLANFEGGPTNNPANAYQQYGFKLDISNWDVTGVTSFYKAFTEQREMNGSQFGQWTTSPLLLNLNNIFFKAGGSATYNNALQNLDLSNWDTSNVTDWKDAFSFSNYSGVGVAGLDFDSFSDVHPNFVFEDVPDFAVGTNVGGWSVPGGDASATSIEFPGFRTPSFGRGNYWGNTFPLTKDDFGDAIVGWANNPNMTINSIMDVTGFIGSAATDYDYSGNATVSAALTTLQNTKGWTLTGFTF